MERSCSGCDHWQKDEGEPTLGNCHRYAPGAPAPAGFTRWPETRAADWCGEFKPRRAT